MRTQNFYIVDGTVPARSGWWPRLRAGWSRAWRLWVRRQELRRLAELDDRLLHDVGVRRGDVERALASPFAHELDTDAQPRFPRKRSRARGGTSKAA